MQQFIINLFNLPSRSRSGGKALWAGTKNKFQPLSRSWSGDHQNKK
jgi:hypothetical protein